MRIAAELVAVIVVACSVLFIRSGLREWRGGGTPVSRRYGLLVDDASRAAWDRAGLVIGLGFAFMAVMLADFGLINPRHPIRAELLIAAAAGAGMVLCIGLFWTIGSFNWPKFLVPPRHRDEPGALAFQRHRREGRHAR